MAALPERALAGDPIDRGTPGVGQPEDAGNLVVGLPGRVIQGRPEQADVPGDVVHSQDLRVPPGDQQRPEILRQPPVRAGDRGALAGCGSIGAPACYVDHRASYEVPLVFRTNGYGVVRHPVEEIHGAINRIHYPGNTAGGFHIGAFFPKDSIPWALGTNGGGNEFLCGGVDLSYRIHITGLGAGMCRDAVTGDKLCAPGGN